MQRERCDWPDVLNLLYQNGPTLDWQHLLNRLGSDAQLLKAILTVFEWICPQVSIELPEWLRDQFGITPRIFRGLEKKCELARLAPVVRRAGTRKQKTGTLTKNKTQRNHGPELQPVRNQFPLLCTPLFGLSFALLRLCSFPLSPAQRKALC